MVKKIVAVLFSFMINLSLFTGFVCADTMQADGEFHNIDLSDVLNADTLIDAAGETLNSDTWFSGLEVNYGQYGGVTKSALIKDGAISFQEQLWDISASKRESTGKTYAMLPNENNDLDAVVISNKKQKSFTINLEQTFTESLFLALKFEVGGSPTVDIRYSDNSTEQITINGSRYAQAVYNNPNDLQKHAMQKDASGDVVWAHEDFRLVSLKDTGYTTYKLQAAEGSAAAVVSQESQTVGVQLYEVKLNQNKIPVSAEIAFDNEYHMAVYSAAQDELKNARLMEKVQEAEMLLEHEISAADMDTVMLANRYADVLETRGYSYDFSKIRSYAYKKVSINDTEKIIQSGEKNLYDVKRINFEWRSIFNITSAAVDMNENGGAFTDFTLSQQDNVLTIAFPHGLSGEAEYSVRFQGVSVDGDELTLPAFTFQTGGIYQDIAVQCTEENIAVGEDSSITVFGITQSGKRLELSGDALAFSSDDETVISVDNKGKMTAHSQGSAGITIVFVDPALGNRFVKTVTIKAYLPVKKAQGNREKISFFFAEAITPVEAYFSDGMTAEKVFEATVSADAEENRVDIIPETPLDLSKQYIVTLVTENMVYQKNIMFEMLMSEDFSDPGAYKRFSQNRRDPKKYADSNIANPEENLLILNAGGSPEASLGYIAQSAEYGSWKDYTVEFDYLREQSGFAAENFYVYFLSSTDTQVMWQYDGKQAATISTIEANTSYILSDKTVQRIGAENLKVTGNKKEFGSSDLRVSASMLENNLMMSVRKINTEEENKLLYSQETVIPVELSELNRQTGTFALSALGSGAKDSDLLAIDNVVCYQTKLSDVAYSASVPFQARDLYNVEEITLLWNYPIETLDMSNLSITATREKIVQPYTDFTVEHDGNKKTKIIFHTPLTEETQYQIAFHNIRTGLAQLQPPELIFFMGGVYCDVFFSEERFIKANGEGHVALKGETQTGNIYTLSDDHTAYSSSDKKIFTIDENGKIVSRDRGLAFIKAVYTDPNVTNTNGDNGTNQFKAEAPVYFYMSKQDADTQTENKLDFSARDAVMKVLVIDDLLKNMSVDSQDNSLAIKTSGKNYQIGDYTAARTRGTHLFEILKCNGKISIYFDGKIVADNIAADTIQAFSVSGEMFEEVSVYNLIGSVCRVSFVNVRNDNGITASYHYEDEDKDEDTATRFQWYCSDSENGAYQPISGQTAKNFQSDGYEGKYIKVAVTPGNRYETGESVMSPAYRVPSAGQSDSQHGGKGSGSSGGSGVKIGGLDKQDDISPTIAIVYRDVDETHWAYDAIAELTNQKVLTGFSNGTFLPEKPVTRAEFICAALKYKKENTAAYADAFEDVKSEDWFAPYVQKAFDKRYVLGDGSCFHPQSNITREEMAVMIARMFQLSAKEGSVFSDAEQISDWALSAVETLSAENIINGRDDNRFCPKENVTRAEMTAILSRIHQ